MSKRFLLYGANGYVGRYIARQAVLSGLEPVLAGRSGASVTELGAALGMKSRVLPLEDTHALDTTLKEVDLVLHCAGPFLYTSRPMVEACLRTGVHYLDLTGEIPVYAAIQKQDAEARERGVMLMPGVGFDVVPTDCLAVHLKGRLPSADRLTLAIRSQGPAGLPPGTQRTGIELARFGSVHRREGKLAVPKGVEETRLIDFGQGPVTASLMNWGDVFTAYYSTGIPNIDDYMVLDRRTRQLLTALDAFQFLFRSRAVRKVMGNFVRPGPTAEQRLSTVTHVWGEVTDANGRRAVSRLHGPEAGVIWTSQCALAVVRRVLAGSFRPGFQTAGMTYGGDFVLETGEVTREDVE